MIILKEEQKNYLYLALFFLIFSIFIYFAIRPSLITIFSLEKQAKDLTQINNFYDAQINKILEIQSQLEKNQNRLYLFSQAITNSPQVNEVISDIKNQADKNNFFLKNVSILDINLLNSEEKNIKSITINIESISDFNNFLKFIDQISNQRRIKKIKQININRNKEEENIASEEAKLKINLEIEAYHL